MDEIMTHGALGSGNFAALHGGKFPMSVLVQRFADLFRFANALLSHKLRNADSTELLITGKVDAAVGRYAYGFEDHRDSDGNGWVGHAGGAPGMNGELRIYPKSGHVVVALANQDPPAAQQISRFLGDRLPR